MHLKCPHMLPKFCGASCARSGTLPCSLPPPPLYPALVVEATFRANNISDRRTKSTNGCPRLPAQAPAVSCSLVGLFTHDNTFFTTSTAVPTPCHRKDVPRQRHTKLPNKRHKPAPIDNLYTLANSQVASFARSETTTCSLPPPSPYPALIVETP